jgi:heat shock protein HtpX
MYSAIARNKRNTVLIILLFLVIIGGLGWLANYVYGGSGYTILIVTLVIAAVYAWIQYYAASSQALLMSGAVPIEKADNPRLWNVVENLSITTGTPMPKVYIVDDLPMLSPPAAIRSTPSLRPPPACSTSWTTRSCRA